jgi:putative endonuclease
VPARKRTFWVYVMSNPWRTLYIGVTSNLERRVAQHKSMSRPGFTARYALTDLVYFEETSSAEAAITREKQLKGWLRSRKVALIGSMNPDWLDLAADTTDPSLRSG